MRRYSQSKKAKNHSFDRIGFLRVVLLLISLVVVARLAHVQLFQNEFYTALAEGQHTLFEHLQPTRGEIYVREDGDLYPLAANKDYYEVYAVPSNIHEPEATAKALKEHLELEDEDIIPRLSKKGDLYEPVATQVEEEVVNKLRELELEGIGFRREVHRYYPEKNIGSHLLGFVGFQDDKRVGQYGLEGYWNEDLAGTQGYLEADRDAGGRWITVGSKKLEDKKDGDSLVLTIDRTVQYKACTELNAAVEKHGASSGSLVIMEPSTGKILAMCGSPDYDLNTYNEVEDINVYLNPSTYYLYEPGSVFKPLTMAAALNEGKVTPDTTYEDTGSVEIGKYTIRNSDGKANGINTMTQVLEKSLNTGAIFAARQIGPEKFEEYVKRFGFGELTGVQVDSELSGDISTLERQSEIFMATASFGQGITVNPLQLVAAFGAIANDGVLMKPYVIDEVIKSDGTSIMTEPEVVRKVITPETAAKLSAMLANVVQNGHGQRAGVDGYFVAGKTGTAQIPLEGGTGYDPNQTIGSFIGFAPVDDPQFVMLAKIDRPQDVQFAESSAAPLFGRVAAFLLPYLGIPPTDANK